ncbi:MAG: glycosyltransferase [Candidatus Binataceae bacterium]
MTALSNNGAIAPNRSPSLSIVIIGRNEGERLDRCLKSVLAIEAFGGASELIYVDSASTDGSNLRAAQFGAKTLSIGSAHPCAAVARNIGWRAAQAPIVLFLDGDTILDGKFLMSSIGEFSDQQVAVVFGNRREIDPSGSIFNRILDLEWMVAPGPVEFCGGDALMRRDVLERVGGYDERLIAGEEPELCRRIRALGYTIKHVNRPMTGHDLAIRRFAQYWRRALRTGYAYAEVSERFKHTDLPLWREQARGNRVRGAVLSVLTVSALSGAIALRMVWPLLVAMAIIAGLAVRTANRSKWRSSNLATRLAFGLHSHFVQIPILFGQLRYFYYRATGKTAQLIEYKDDAKRLAGSSDT